MISKTVEEVARAICKADGDNSDNWEEWISHAVAAWMAMQKLEREWRDESRATDREKHQGECTASKA